MRRKLFFYVLILIVTIHFLELLETPILNTEIKTKIGETYTHYGKLISIKYNNNDSYKVVIKLDNSEKVLISLYDNTEALYDYYGCYVSFSSNLELPDSQRNPGCFDYRKYLKSIGIIAIGSTNNLKILDSNLSIWDGVNKQLLLKKNAFIESLSNDEVKGFVSGILFGDKELLGDDIYEEFKNNGTAHILAVSGLHIGVLYGILEKLLGKRQTKINLAVITIVLLLLGCIASWTPSVTRALGMVFMKLIARFTDHRYDILTAMSVVAFVSVASNPYVIYNTGFQMSYLAVISIAFVMPHISRKIPDFAAIIISVNFGLVPYQMFQFNTLSLTAFFANIPIVYLAGIIMPIVAFAFVLNVFGVQIFFLEILIESLSNFIISINRWCTLGIGSIDVISPPLLIMVIFYVVVFFMLSETYYILLLRKNYTKITKIIVLLLTLAIGISALDSNGMSKNQIVFIDVGQGDAIHIRDKDKDVLIDGGGSVNYNIGKNTLKPYFLKNGTRKIELALATHKHTDHYKGIEELYEEGLIEKILTRRTAGQKYYLSDDVYVETLWPLAKDINSPNCADPNQEENKYCSVFMVFYKGTKILITGDIDEEGEKQIIRHYIGTGKLKADILKVGHHGSQYSTCDEFLDAVDPKFCVIQVGDNNYGHPHMKIIEKCNKKGIIILRNDFDGAIGFWVEDGKLKYNTMIKDN